jgi:hypothetical protein
MNSSISQSRHRNKMCIAAKLFKMPRVRNCHPLYFIKYDSNWSSWYLRVVYFSCYVLCTSVQLKQRTTCLYKPFPRKSIKFIWASSKVGFKPDWHKAKRSSPDNFLCGHRPSAPKTELHRRSSILPEMKQGDRRKDVHIILMYLFPFSLFFHPFAFHISPSKQSAYTLQSTGPNSFPFWHKWHFSDESKARCRI